MKIEKEKTVFDEQLVVQKGEIRDDGKTLTKFRLNREDAAVIFLLNTDSDTVVLTKQFRYPIASKSEERILELAAGKIDKGEEPMQAALREAREETGYAIKKENIKILFSCFASPGYSSERFFIYYATVTNKDKVSEGGGLKKENERIEVVEIDRNKFMASVKDGSIKDAKTYLASMYLELYCFFSNTLTTN